MNKIMVEITECSDCDYFYMHHIGPTPRCTKKTRGVDDDIWGTQGDGRKLPKSLKIPGWCPRLKK